MWPRREQLTTAVTPYLIERLDPREGERILEVGPGGGSATLAFAGRVGSGTVVGVDLSHALVELARRRAREAGATNISLVVADAQDDTIAGAPFDAVVSQFGVMFFDEPVRAFANLRAHVAEGGRLAFACWRGADLNPWNLLATLAPFVAPPSPPEPGKSLAGLFSLADPAATTSLLEAAGWSSVARQAHDVVVVVERDAVFDEQFLTLIGVEDDVLDDARHAVDERLSGLTRADGRLEASLAFQVFTASNA